MAIFDESGFPTHYDFEDLPTCSGCSKVMIPNLSTWDSAPFDDDGTVEGCGWICTTSGCREWSGFEIEVEDLTVLGVPEWLADRIVEIADMVDTLEDMRVRFENITGIKHYE